MEKGRGCFPDCCCCMGGAERLKLASKLSMLALVSSATARVLSLACSSALAGFLRDVLPACFLLGLRGFSLLYSCSCLSFNFCEISRALRQASLRSCCVLWGAQSRGDVQTERYCVYKLAYTFKQVWAPDLSLPKDKD